MRVKSTKKIASKTKTKNTNQLELTFRENIKNKKDTNHEYNKSFNAISRIFLSSFVIVSFFYIIPIFINFADKNFNNKEFTNNSKKILAYTLNSKNQKAKDNENLAEEDLLFDIFSLNDLETDSVRLSAATIKQLFEDTNYSLKDVRKNKLVKPVALTLLPQEIKMIENTKKRKEFFIQIVLPLIVKENNNIRIDRKTLFRVINKSNNSVAEKQWIEKKYKQYGVKSGDLSSLKVRMDEIPVSLAIAQAAKETGMGYIKICSRG